MEISSFEIKPLLVEWPQKWKIVYLQIEYVLTASK